MISTFELIDSHLQGFGGSDAKMLRQIGEEGKLTPTAERRVREIAIRQSQSTFGGNVYTAAGHQFERAIANWLKAFGSAYIEEYTLEQQVWEDVRTFAHADFAEIVDDRLVVYECKFTKAPTASALKRYSEQLQWYYLLGADVVKMVSGHGTADPFNVEAVEIVEVDYDGAICRTIAAGLAIAVGEIRRMRKALQEGNS